MPLRFRLIASLLPFLLTASIATAAPTIRRRAVTPPTAQSSESLIDAALAKGAIDANTALQYRVFADFGDARLPDAFKGDLPPDTDSTSVAEAAAHWDSLPESVQEAIAPYLIPPFQKGSWANPQSTASSTHPLLNPLQLCGAVDHDDWVSVAATSGKLRIWWQKIHPDDAAVAQDLAADGDLALQQYSGLLGHDVIPDNGSVLPCRGGDDAIDVALADIPRSQTIPFLPATKKVSSFVVLQRNADDGPEATLAHELFHVLQLTYDVDQFSLAGNYKWLMEATAQWAMDYHRREGNSGKEQRAAPRWLGEPDQSLTLVDANDHEYGAYLFFLYLSRTFGDSIVKTIWDATETHDAVNAVDSAIPGGFKERWPEFAIDVWNHAPLDKFNQWDQLALTPFAQSGTALAGQPDLYVNLSANLPPLSAKYVHVTFDSTARSVGFLNGLTYDLTTMAVTPGPVNFGPLYQWSDASDDAKRGASIHAIVKKNGQWQAPEDWSSTKIKAFCRQKPDEAIDEIVLILTNSDTDPNHTLKSPDIDSELIATNIGCEWSGTMHFTSSDAVAVRAGHVEEDFDLKRDRDESFPISETQLGYRYITTGHASWTVSGTLQSCRLEGHDDNAPLMPNLASYTFNFFPQESAAYRKAAFAVMLQKTIKFEVECPGADPLPDDAASIGFMFPPQDILRWIDIRPDGTLDGEMTEPNGVWKWNYKPQ